MKTILKIQKNILSKLTRVLMFGAIICFGFKADAQCLAGYTYTIDPANNGNVTFANTSTGSGLYYQWDLGDGTFYPNIITPGTYTYASTGIYNVCLTVYDSIGVDSSGTIISGCSDTFCSSITVTNSTATCNAYFYTYIDSTGAVSIYNISSGSITNYYWDFGDGTTSTNANPSPHSYPGAGYYTICLTTTNSGTLCNSTYCDTILVSNCSASFTFAQDTLGNGCNFWGSSTGSGSSYYWNFGDGSTSTLQNPYHVYATNGFYNVCLTVTSFLDTTCYSMTCQGIYMSGICNAYFVVQQDSTNLYNYFVYNYSSPSGVITYLWDFGDGTTSTLAYPTHTYALSVPTQLCLTVSDGSGCTDMFCDTIIPGLAMSSVFTINVINPLGVSENVSTISSLENYPNPFSDNTTINYVINKDANVSVSIIDLLGNTVAELENGNKTSGEYSRTWNAENVAGGMYLLQLKVNNDISTKKIIVNK